MEDREIDPSRISGVNELDEAKVRRLADSMRAHGWPSGERRLLVEEATLQPIPGAYDQPLRLHAWTGSHRIAAAKLAGLTVPCRVITVREADAAFGGAGFDRYGFNSWRDCATATCGRSDRHRLVALEKTALKEAAAMLRDEIEAVEG